MGLISNGTTIFNNGSFSVGGSLTLISTQTASNSASISFTTGINSTYKEYQFWFIDIKAGTATTKFSFNGSTDSGSNYNVTKTTTVFNAFHYENDSGYNLNYDDNSSDIAQGTGFQSLTQYAQNADADSATSGVLQLFNPSSTTYAKHFISVSNMMGTGGGNPFISNSYVAGYLNTTSAVNAIQFKMSSGNFDGTIAMFGVL